MARIVYLVPLLDRGTTIFGSIVGSAGTTIMPHTTVGFDESRVTAGGAATGRAVAGLNRFL